MVRTLIATWAIFGLAPALSGNGEGKPGGVRRMGCLRDPQVPRCYAIARPEPSSHRRDFAPYSSVGTWPKRNVRGQAYVRLSRQMATSSTVTLTVGRTSFRLQGSGADAWAPDDSINAQVLAAMRTAATMRVSARDTAGNRFTDTYRLRGAATALDAALLGCAKPGRG